MAEYKSLMKGRSGQLFWIPAAMLALHFILVNLYTYIQNILTYEQPNPVAVIVISVAWSATFTLGWLVSFILLAVRTDRKEYAAGFLVMAATSLLNFFPACFGGYYMIYVLVNTYHVMAPISKILSVIAAVICLIQAAAFAVFLFGRGGNAVVRTGSALALVCTLAVMASNLLLLIPSIATAIPRLPTYITYFGNMCAVAATFALISIIGGICFGKPRRTKRQMKAEPEAASIPSQS